MSTSTTFTATHSSGATAKRTSKTKTYGFIVWCQHTAEHYRTSAERSLNRSRNEQARYKAVVAGDVPNDSKYVTLDDYRRYIADLDVRIAALDAQLDANEYADDEWGAWSWSSRRDLAEKEVRSALKRCPLSNFEVGEVD